MSKITKILSHPQALAQSQQFLETHYIFLKNKVNYQKITAAMYVAEHPKEDAAAIRYNSYISLERFFMKSRKLTKLNTYYFSYFR
ncbi:hypothetical protein EfmAA96_16470 [Enterococcus faecium]|nr:hypothetical protein EfmAA96_16470 [Enterococcus faecium]